MAMNTTERLDDLEILVAHQAQTIEELSDVVARQGDTISDLQRRLEAMIRRFADAEEQLRGAIPVDKPPHW